MAKAKKLSQEEEAALQAVHDLKGRPGTAPVAPKASLWSRRDFFGRLGWGGFGLFTGLSLLGFVRSAFPRVLFTPPSTFKAGLPSDYTIGEVSERFKKEHRVWIIRESDGFYALFAKCTHLGCTPRWLQVEEKFKCPCHGSGFRKSGVNFEGPAPRPLERFRITLAEDGQLLVDMSVMYRFERGDWDKPGAFLRV
jgi:cytochrome b6-f complex iron-sulfur subunit